MRKLLVIGASGLLGNKLLNHAKGGYDAIGTCNPEADGRAVSGLEPLDICSGDDVRRLMDRLCPELAILTAAMTDVDACELKPELAHRVNSEGPENVARACRSVGARMIHVSTDYVFDGTKASKYSEDDDPNPISVYGASKLAGERAVLSVLPDAVVGRTAVLYGWSLLEQKGNFATWVLKKLRGGQEATLFEDQRISPTLADDLADALLGLAKRDVSGVWHVSGPDCLDRPSCGRLIAKVFGLDETLVVPVLSSSMPLPAKRPAYSCMDVSKVERLLSRKMVSFREGLEIMRRQEQEASRT